MEISHYYLVFPYLLIVFSNTTTVSQQNQAIYHEIVAVKPDLNL